MQLHWLVHSLVLELGIMVHLWMEAAHRWRILELALWTILDSHCIMSLRIHWVTEAIALGLLARMDSVGGRLITLVERLWGSMSVVVSGRATYSCLYLEHFFHKILVFWYLWHVKAILLTVYGKVFNDVNDLHFCRSLRSDFFIELLLSWFAIFEGSWTGCCEKFKSDSILS